MYKKLGKKEDEHVVASDSELDAKLEVKLDTHYDLIMPLCVLSYSLGHLSVGVWTQ